MLGKGIFEVTLSSGKTIGFKFGTRAAAFSEKEAGISIGLILLKISENKGETTVSLLHYFYGGAASYCLFKKTDPPTLEQFEEQIDEMDFNDLLRIYQDSVRTPKLPNVQAPPTGQ